MADVDRDNELVSEEYSVLLEETRPIYRLQSFVDRYKIDEPQISLIDRAKKCVPLNFEYCINAFLNKIPLIRCLKEYNLRENLFGDITAGITISIMHIPQGMAYSVLATLPAVHGNQLFLFLYFNENVFFEFLYRIVCFVCSGHCLYDLWYLSSFIDR
jgi:hypothetical protein